MPDRLDQTNLSESQRRLARFTKATLLDPKGLDAAIIDVRPDGGLVYDYWGLVFAFMQEMPEMTEEDAVEWVEYNTLRAIPYMPDPKPEVRTT